MSLKRYKPTTPGRRKASVLDSSDLAKKRPEKGLTIRFQRKSGRNNQGIITVRHQGGGAKRLYRMVDFVGFRFDDPAKVIAIEYDPNRSARIALVEYSNGERAYVLASQTMKAGDTVLSSQKKIEAKDGNRMPLAEIPVGLFVYNVELTPLGGGKIIRSAGAGAQLQTIEGKYAQLRLPSGEVRLVQKNCLATIGMVSNPDYNLVRYGTAGRRRHLGWRPHVKGKNMNPVDHPHGGGEGHSPIGFRGGPKTPWGKKALGVKTRKRGKISDKFILRRRKEK